MQTAPCCIPKGVLARCLASRPALHLPRYVDAAALAGRGAAQVALIYLKHQLDAFSLSSLTVYSPVSRACGLTGNAAHWLASRYSLNLIVYYIPQIRICASSFIHFPIHFFKIFYFSPDPSGRPKRPQTVPLTSFTRISRSPGSTSSLSRPLIFLTFAPVV